MKTTKAQSTISYNSIEYLKLKLNELLNGHYIQFWAFIHHLPEQGDATGGLKEHCHLYIEPTSKRFDTEDFRDYLKEPDLVHPDRPPLGCITLRACNSFADWYLYGLHDEKYLTSKLLTREFHYAHSDYVVSDSDTFAYMISQIDYSPLKTFDRFREYVLEGLDFNSILNAGFIPVNQIYQYEKAFKYLSPHQFQYKTADPRFSAQNAQKDPSMVDDDGKPLFDKEIKY